MLCVPIQVKEEQQQRKKMEENHTKPKKKKPHLNVYRFMCRPFRLHFESFA